MQRVLTTATECEYPPPSLLLTNPPSHMPLPQVSYGIIGSFLTPPLPGLFNPLFYDSFKIEAHWLISAIKVRCKGDWIHPEWELNRFLSSSWRAFAVSCWTFEGAMVVLQLNLDPLPSAHGLTYLRALLIQGPHHTDLVIWDSPQPHAPVPLLPYQGHQS